MEEIVSEHCISQRVMDPIKGKALIKQTCLSGLNEDPGQAGRSQGLSGRAASYGQPGVKGVKFAL